MHRLEICVSSWPTHIFKAIKIVDGYLAQQRNKIGKVQNATLCLPNHIPVCSAHWFKCHFRQLYSKADWSEIHFLCKLSLPFYAFIFTSPENMLLLPGLHMGTSSVLVLIGSHSHCNSFVVNQFLFSHQMEKIPLVIHPRSNGSNGVGKNVSFIFY